MSYHIRFFCDCGWDTAPWKGSRFFIDEDVCPKCGRSKETFRESVGRFEKRPTGERGFLGFPKCETVWTEAKHA
ncbi:hypothetical protein H9Q09_11820 [Aurantimonas sp. DM33-3]|uniref:hypothetical protein n=1 Tax=Aurantimonas sp. DM33-3 TaxID=2766955 RepID=UPI0016526EE8|nr:hypothetical protein [Aurantimonas sp. DM33-3]MBC6716895.1 hypothetical protein [Aurantimonas sp. DM33-3]